MTLTKFQQGELSAFLNLHTALLELHDAGEQLEVARVFELLEQAISVLEAFDKDDIQEHWLSVFTRAAETARSS